MTGLKNGVAEIANPPQPVRWSEEAEAVRDSLRTNHDEQKKGLPHLNRRCSFKFR